MMPSKQSALEALAGRSLTADEITATDADIASGSINTIAQRLSVGRTQWVATEVGKGTILETIGLTAGNVLCDYIDSAADFRHVKHLLTDGRLRLDSALVRSTLASMVPALLTQAQCNALLALAQRTNPVTDAEVQTALGA